MSKITALFWDIGGVILTNGWDRHSRREAAEKFHLDWEEFQDRHDFSFPGFDSGHITLNEYLDRTLFYRPRQFSREEFVEFMFAQSKEYPRSAGGAGPSDEIGEILNQFDQQRAPGAEPISNRKVRPAAEFHGVFQLVLCAGAEAGRNNLSNGAGSYATNRRASASLSMTGH